MKKLHNHTNFVVTKANCTLAIIQNKFFVKKRQGPESTSSQATKRADIKIWPRNFCDLILLGIKNFKNCYLIANHSAYVVAQQSYVISLYSIFKKTRHKYSVQSCDLNIV